ncbi:hypothetical protein [Polaribacter sp.]|uniref:hypothetical protein n=1 Tax=Polaribacter sp. TaxID=1920175 RepID=UPI003F6C6016
MRNLKTIIAIIAISLSTTLATNASEINPKKNKETKSLRTEVSKFIGKNIPVELKKTTHTEISFIVNNKNEVVVLSVDSKVAELNSYLKSKLNYKKISTKGIKKGEIYKMPLKIKVNK